MMMSFPRRMALCLACLSLTLALPAGAAPENKQHQHRTAKPSAGLSLATGSEFRLEAGQVQSVTIALSSEAQQGALNLAMSSTDPRLEILSPTTHTFDLSDGAPTLTVELLPHEDGRYYLMFNARLEQPGQPAQGQSIGAAIQVGDKPIEAQRLKATSAPEVISLPAQESVRPAN